jgi:hypothetical protein
MQKSQVATFCFLRRTHSYEKNLPNNAKVSSCNVCRVWLLTQMNDFLVMGWLGLVMASRNTQVKCSLALNYKLSMSLSIHAFPRGLPSKQKPFNAKEINHISKFPFIQSISLVQFAFFRVTLYKCNSFLFFLEIYNYFTILFHENMGNVHLKVPWHAHQIKIIVITIGIYFTNGRYLVLGIKATFPKGVLFKNQNDFLIFNYLIR